MTSKRINNSVKVFNPLESKHSLPNFDHQNMATINQTYVNFNNSIHITNINLSNSSLNSDEFRVDDIYSNSGNVSDCNSELDSGDESTEYFSNGFYYNPLIHSTTRNSKHKKTMSFTTTIDLPESASLDCFEEEDLERPADVERRMGRVVEPDVIMSYLMQVQDPGNVLIKVFVVLDRGFISIFHDRLPDKNPIYPYGDTLIKKMLLADCTVMSGEKNIAIVTDLTEKQRHKNTRWIRAECPGLKAMIRPFPSFELPATSAIKDGEEVEIFLKPFSGYWCLKDGRGYFCCIVKGVTWIEIDAPSKLTSWIRIDCAPGTKVPLRSNANIQDAPISFLTVGSEVEVYNRTESGFYKLVNGKGYVNKHTKNVTFADIDEPSSAAATRREKEKKEIIEGSNLVFQPLDASITGLAVKDWVKALNHHVAYAQEHYALENVDYALALQVV